MRLLFDDDSFDYDMRLLFDADCIDCLMLVRCFINDYVLMHNVDKNC